MKSKYVCRGLVSLYVYFHNNRTMWSTNLHVKLGRWGEKEKEPRTAKGKKIFKKVSEELMNDKECCKHQRA